MKIESVTMTTSPMPPRSPEVSPRALGFHGEHSLKTSPFLPHNLGHICGERLHAEGVTGGLGAWVDFGQVEAVWLLPK